MHSKTFIYKGAQGWKNYLHLLANWMHSKTLICQVVQACKNYLYPFVATPLWDKCEGEAHTPKSAKLESSGTPKNSELQFRGQISSHFSVLYVIEKVLKCRCPKWPRMSHLDIFSPSYGQKKGQESNW